MDILGCWPNCCCRQKGTTEGRMDDLPGERSFFTSTRGRILVLLRRANRTVEELAVALGLTDNAVRAQLVTLERDGWVARGPPRRSRQGAGKPAFTYQLTRPADRLFPHAYAVLLAQLLDGLAEALPPAERDAILRAVGDRLPAVLLEAAGPPQDRVGAAAALLTRLGGAGGGRIAGRRADALWLQLP